MFDNRKDEFISTPSGAAETIVGTSVKLKGNLKSDGDITIDGSINGEIKTKGTVNVGPKIIFDLKKVGLVITSMLVLIAVLYYLIYRTEVFNLITSRLGINY